jgi:hypothetical protein
MDTISFKLNFDMDNPVQIKQQAHFQHMVTGGLGVEAVKFCANDLGQIGTDFTASLSFPSFMILYECEKCQAPTMLWKTL